MCPLLNPVSIQATKVARHQHLYRFSDRPAPSHTHPQRRALADASTLAVLQSRGKPHMPPRFSSVSDDRSFLRTATFPPSVTDQELLEASSTSRTTLPPTSLGAARLASRHPSSNLVFPPGWADPKGLPSFPARSSVFPSDAEALDLFSADFTARTDELLTRCLASCLAPSTLTGYFYAWRRWVDTCKAKGWTPIPADPTHFGRHLTFLAQNSQQVGGVSMAIHAVNYVHKLNRLPLPGHAPLVQSVHEAVRRDLSRPLHQKEPLLPWMVQSIVSLYCTDTSASWQWMIGTAILFHFCIMARYDDLAALRLDPEYCEIHNTHVTFFIERRKTDQYGRGQYVDVSASATTGTGSPSCPVFILREYIRRFGSRGPLLKPFGSDWWRGQKVVDTTAEPAMPYPTFLKEFRLALREACGMSELQAKDFGLHSARSGGATEAFRAGIASELVMRQAGVTGHNWRIRYERPSLEARLGVTRILGL
jgi:hypothetical protein